MLFDFWKRKKAPLETPVTVTAAATTSPSALPLMESPRAANDMEQMAVASGAHAFPTLGEKELLTLFKFSNVRKLEAGEVLYRATDPVDYFYLVIKGTLRIDRPAVGKKKPEPELLHKGSWVTDFNLSDPVPRKCRATAVEASAVMLINNAVLNQLDDRMKLALFGKIHKINTQRIVQLSNDKDQVDQKNGKLVDGLISASHKYDPDVAGSELIQSIIQKIPRLPVSTSALLGKLMDRSSTTQEIVELVKQDPSLTGAVLKTINSSRFNFEQKISDVNHAVMLLGYDGVYQMVMASGFRKCLPDTELFHDMYERSLAISGIAFSLSQEARVGQPAELATIGLLHQIGLTVTELLKQHYPKMIPLIMYLEDTDMGAALLRAWNIPESVAKCIERQRYPEFAPPAEVDPEVREAVAILYLSQLCYRRIIEGEAADLPLLFLDEYLAVVNWSQESLDSIVNQILLPKLRKQRKGLPQSLLEHLGE